MGRLFWKFFLAIWLAQTIAVLAVSSGIWIRDRNQARRTERLEFGPPARTILDGAEVAFRYGGTAALRDLLQKERREKVFAVNEQGRELLGRPIETHTYESVQKLQRQGSHAESIRMLGSAEAGTWLLYVQRGEPRRLPLAEGHGLIEGPGPGGPGPRGRVRFPWMSVLLAMLASFVAAGLLAWYLAKPIRRLRHAFNTVAAGDLDTRVGPVISGGRDELSDLGMEFDRMASRLQALMQGQQRLLHDVSHELRSPLARLQVAIGLARQRPDKTANSLDRIERESERMNRLIDGLLTLSRLESGTAGAMDEQINVEELLADVLQDASYEAQSVGKQVKLAMNPGGIPAIVRGRAELLQSAVENVVRNAVRYTLPGTAVEIGAVLQTSQRQVHIVVRDHGPGVPTGDLGSIFQPFVQVRNSLKASDGYGLGLAIAERVINAHGGSITATNAKDGGLHVDISLPVMESQSNR